MGAENSVREQTIIIAVACCRDAALLQRRLQALVLLAQLADEAVGRRLVHRRLRLDRLGAVGCRRMRFGRRVAFTNGQPKRSVDSVSS